MKNFMLALLFLFQVQAYAQTLRGEKGNVRFVAKANPGFMKIEGSSGAIAPKGVLHFTASDLSGEFGFSLVALETGIELRDEHMKEKYLEVAKFPEAKLVLRPIKQSGIAADKDFSGKFTATLTLHGMTKEVGGDFEYVGSEKKLQARFQLRVSEFGIDVPSWMGVTVTDTVDVSVTSELN
jgi:polyisoprenoid-binding protein YceI